MFHHRAQQGSGLDRAQALLVQGFGQRVDLGVRLACTLLESSSNPVKTVAESCGFANEATLRHHFRNHLRVSPAAYRAKFGKPTDGRAARRAEDAKRPRSSSEESGLNCRR